MKHPKRLDTYTIVSKNEIKSIGDLSPVWASCHDLDKTLTFDEVAKKSDIVIKVKFKKESNISSVVKLHFEVIKNVHNEIIIGKTPKGSEEITVLKTGYRLIELVDAKSEENYNRHDMSVFMRRYLFSPDSEKMSKISNNNVQYDFGAFVPFVGSNLAEGENFIFIIDFKNECIQHVGRDKLLKQIKNLPNV